MAFDLLQDFWASLPQLDVDGVNVSRLDRDLIDDVVRRPLTMALDAVEGPVETYDYARLREKTANAIKDDEFCITLDHSIYFFEADFQLDLSRTASDLRRTGSQHLTRRPRSIQDLPTQLADLSSALATSRKKRVVLADDGLATGQTLSMVISRCHDYNIEVRRVAVCCNNTELTQLANSVKVSSIVKRAPGRPWLNERDLYWGLPHSGLTLAPTSKAARTYSIPFSANSRLVQQRICVEDDVDQFRSACLRANRELWLLFERQAGHPLNCEDCPPLRFIPDLLGYRNRRVVDLLVGLLEGTDELDLEATVVRISSL